MSEQAEAVDDGGEVDKDARRAIPVEQLRRWYQDQCELTSIRDVCTDVGIGRTTLHKFVAGETIPHPRNRRMLALHYVKRVGLAEPDDEDGRMAESAVGLLSRFFPPKNQRRMRLVLLDRMEDEFREAGCDVPEWLPRLRERE
ncbi:MAG TPA: hypothetical protein VLK84_19005 [Longimicrobium sp.]|nr:hypothetical protein [Longimicrobium sp.]